jgi:hypothetical protein
VSWNRQKVDAFRSGFDQFLMHVRVNSKEKGNICLGDHVYRAQQMLLDGIFDGLANDIHDFKILKSRQLGVSTLSRALTLFWIGVNQGLRGYMIFDTDGHKEEARLELLGMIQMLPTSLGFPVVKRQNRYLLELSNGSTMNFANAGVRTGKTSGTLGRSSGVNFHHRSELCSYADPESMEAYQNALAEDFEDRLYIDESTARGFGLWHEIWTAAKLTPRHSKCIFLGWWAKDNQRIARTDPDFERFGGPPSEEERDRVREVKQLYGWEVTPEQLAWYRRKMSPAAKSEGDAPPDFGGDPMRIQEQPWTEDEAFQMTGSVFFDPPTLTEMVNANVSKNFKTYSYQTGIEFTDCRITPAWNARSVELKVWEEPDEGSVYVVSADVAFGANEKNDRSAIQVLKCYADGLDQVAEYAWPLINSRAFAWVIASLLGWYAGETSDVYLILELNGPGEATWNELQSLKRLLSSGYRAVPVQQKGLRDIFNNVRNYIYTRSDSMGGGHAWQWKTTSQLKITIMERLRDFVSNGMLRIRSLETIEEMRSVARDGDSIEAQGTKKDDRVISLALGVRCWEERARRQMIGQKRTREAEIARKRLTIKDQFMLFNQNQLTAFFEGKQKARRQQFVSARRAAWRAR